MNKGQEEMRSEFEANMLSHEHPVIGWIDSHWFCRGDDPHTYASDYVQGAWVGWQARQQAPAEQEAVAWALPDSDPNAPRPFLLLVHSLNQVARPGDMVPLYKAPFESQRPDLELMGVIEEYRAMPCESLRQRMFSAVDRYRRRLSAAPAQPVTDTALARVAELEAAFDRFAKRAISICGGEASEWDSDEVIPTKNYAAACERRIRRLRDELRAALAKHGEKS